MSLPFASGNSANAELNDWIAARFAATVSPPPGKPLSGNGQSIADTDSRASVSVDGGVQEEL